jgi:hypothetical protein
MKSKSHKREKKKVPGVFRQKREANKARRKYIITLLLGGEGNGTSSSPA